MLNGREEVENVILEDAYIIFAKLEMTDFGPMLTPPVISII